MEFASRLRFATWDILLREVCGKVDGNGLYTLDRRLRPAAEVFRAGGAVWVGAGPAGDVAAGPCAGCYTPARYA